MKKHRQKCQETREKCNIEVAVKRGEGEVYLTLLENLPKTSAEKEKAESDGGADTIKKEAWDPWSPDIPCETSLDQTDSSQTV